MSSSLLFSSTASEIAIATAAKRLHFRLFYCVPLLVLIVIMQLPHLASTFTIRSYASKDAMVGSVHRKGVVNDENNHILLGTSKVLPTFHNIIQTRLNFRKKSVALQMVVTKSGGRAIQSQLQFDIEVLHQVEQISTESLPLVDSKGGEELLGKDANAKNIEGVRRLFTPSTVPTLVFFSAPWCGPCRLSNPVVKEIIQQFVPRIDVVEVCTDDLPEIAEEAGVTSIPTIQIYHEGKLLDTIVGCVAKNVLGNAVNKVLEDLGLDTETLGEKRDVLDDEDDDDSL